MANNCETMLPLSEDYFSGVSTTKLWFIGLDVLLTGAILLLLLDDVIFVCRTYHHQDIKTTSIWLIVVYPVMALSALVAVCIPRASYICDFVSTVYVAACLSQFSSLILLYFGNREQLVMKVKDTGFSLRTRPCCCCCCCCPTLKSTLRNLLLLRVMILQTAVIQPIIQFISAVLWADNKFDKSGIDFRKSFIYLTSVNVTSTMIALHGLNALHAATASHLRTHSTAVKKLMLQLVLTFQNIQGSILTSIARFNVPTCSPTFSSYSQMQDWHHLLIVAEMFLLAMVTRVFYRRPLQLDAALEEQPGDLVSIYVTKSQRSVEPLPVPVGHVGTRTSLGLEVRDDIGSQTTVGAADADVTAEQGGRVKKDDRTEDSNNVSETRQLQSESKVEKSDVVYDAHDDRTHTLGSLLTENSLNVV